MAWSDAEKRRAYDREWHKKNAERRTQVQIERQRKRREWFLCEVKPKYSCIHCGESDPVVIDFHHLDRSKKEFSISKSWGLSKKRILAELDKCVPLCANCHRREEHRIRTSGIGVSGNVSAFQAEVAGSTSGIPVHALVV